MRRTDGTVVLADRAAHGRRMHRYVVHLAVEVTAPDDAGAVQDAFAQVLRRGPETFTCSVEEIGGAGTVPAPFAPDAPDNRFRGEFLG